VVRGYFASQNTLFPALYGTIVVIVSIPLYLLGMNLLGVRGVALAVSVSGIFQVTVLYALWNKRSNNTESREVYTFYVKVMCFAAGLGIFLVWFKSVALDWIDATTFIGSLTMCALTGAVFLLILLGAGYGLKIKEVTELVDRLVKKPH
jgi:putative peptidoglycan lipid II flippase